MGVGLYQVFVETAPLDDEVELESLAGQLAGALNGSVFAKGAVIGTNASRRTLDMTCSVDLATDARAAIVLAANEFEAYLESFGLGGVRILHAEADPEVISHESTDALADLVTSTEAAEIVGVSRQRFNDLARRGGFPPAFGRIGKAIVYSRSGVQRWADARGSVEAPAIVPSLPR
jgi:hypothetical protein